MKKAEFTILSWKDESHEQETPVLFVGDRIRTVKLEVGMTIYGIGDGGAYRLDDLEFANERDEKNGVFTLTLIRPAQTQSTSTGQRLSSRTLRTVTFGPPRLTISPNLASLDPSELTGGTDAQAEVIAAMIGSNSFGVVISIGYS